MFLLVPAHPCFPGQIPQSRKTVVLCVFSMLVLLILSCLEVSTDISAIKELIDWLVMAGCDFT